MFNIKIWLTLNNLVNIYSTVHVLRRCGVSICQRGWRICSGGWVSFLPCLRILLPPRDFSVGVWICRYTGRRRQDPDFDKQHADTHRGMRWPQKVIIIVTGSELSLPISVSKLWNCHVINFTPPWINALCFIKHCLFNFVEYWCEWDMNRSWALRYHMTSHYVNACIDWYRWTTRALCDRCVLAVKLTIDRTVIICAVELTVFDQFRWKSVWMCMK